MIRYENDLNLLPFVDALGSTDPPFVKGSHELLDETDTMRNTLLSLYIRWFQYEVKMAENLLNWRKLIKREEEYVYPRTWDEYVKDPVFLEKHRLKCEMMDIHNEWMLIAKDLKVIKFREMFAFPDFVDEKISGPVYYS